MSEPTATEGKPLATASQTPQDGPNSTITDENQFRKAILAWRGMSHLKRPCYPKNSLWQMLWTDT